jgi:hypoxanthine phosphoribosyltransferase
VIIVEDIIDTGLTLHYLRENLRGRGPASVELCALLDKKAVRKGKELEDMRARYVGFECPDEFVVGYGLDYKGRYRNLPFIGVLRPEVYS